MAAPEMRDEDKYKMGDTIDPDDLQIGENAEHYHFWITDEEEGAVIMRSDGTFEREWFIPLIQLFRELSELGDQRVNAILKKYQVEYKEP